MSDIFSRILYGKVRKKSAVNLRDAMFEFLMSCQNDEVIFFFDMVFKEISFIAKGKLPLDFTNLSI